MTVTSWSDLPFNRKPGTILHVDLNSAFASIEQLCDVHLRGRPVAVAAYASPRGCIIAPSIEAKRHGIKVRMRVQDGKKLCRDLVILPPDPNKYRSVHLKLKNLLDEYTDDVRAKSIDEFVLNTEGFPLPRDGVHGIAREIKERIRAEVGESLTVSIGIGPNAYLAKTAASLHKPDGLDEIHHGNVLDLFAKLQLMDLCGIKKNNCIRLNRHAIFTVLDFYHATVQTLQAAFQSVEGYYWHLRLHGWEIDDVIFDRHSYGNSFALPKPLSAPEELAPYLQKLVFKTGYRMRKAGYECRGVHVALVYRDGGHWHRGLSLAEPIFDTQDIYRLAFRLLCSAPYRKPVSAVAESVFSLERRSVQQRSLFEDVEKKRRLSDTLDTLQDRWQNYVVTPARMLLVKDVMPDRISFGGIGEIEDWVRG